MVAEGEIIHVFSYLGLRTALVHEQEGREQERQVVEAAEEEGVAVEEVEEEVEVEVEEEVEEEGEVEEEVA